MKPSEEKSKVLTALKPVSASGYPEMAAGTVKYDDYRVAVRLLESRQERH